MLKNILYIIGGLFMASAGLNLIVSVIQETVVLLLAGVVQFFIGFLLLAIASAQKPKTPDSIPTIKVCPMCGSENNLAYRFCGNCGARLKEDNRR